jgi:iron complex transport system substrate-binding protein
MSGELFPVFNEILGREVHLPKKPERIVSFAPAITEALFELGAGERVIGVSPFCARPQGQVRKKARVVGSYNTVNLKLLKELRPDLIFCVTGYQREFATKLASEDNGNGDGDSFPVYPIELPISVAGIIQMVQKVALVIGEQRPGWNLTSFLLRELSSSAKAAEKSESKRVYVELDLGGPVSFGAYSYITDAFHLMGAETIFDDERCEWLTPEFSRVIDADPDFFFYEGKMYSKFDSRQLEELVEKRGWRNLQAIRNHRYFLTPGPLDFLAS